MGLFWGTLRVLRETQVSAQVAYCRAFKRGEFQLQGRTYPYFYHRYNRTLYNERAVEVPIVWDEVKRRSPASVLEIGNVLAHYFSIKHQVVDKYEQGPGVIQTDVVDFHPAQRYDLIVAISTLEHVGWDEEPSTLEQVGTDAGRQDSEKLLQAIDHLATLLAPGGTLLATMPLGYNPALDRFLAEGRVPFTASSYMKRDVRENRWREASWGEIEGLAYVHSKPKSLRRRTRNTALAIVVGRIVHS
jgi:SAM-dependent methyltransferase